MHFYIINVSNRQNKLKGEYMLKRIAKFIGSQKHPLNLNCSYCGDIYTDEDDTEGWGGGSGSKD